MTSPRFSKTIFLEALLQDNIKSTAITLYNFHDIET
jgi:hypothetical protein